MTFARPFPRVEKLGMKSLPMPIGSFVCLIGQFGFTSLNSKPIQAQICNNKAKLIRGEPKSDH